MLGEWQNKKARTMSWPSKLKCTSKEQEIINSGRLVHSQRMNQSQMHKLFDSHSKEK